MILYVDIRDKVARLIRGGFIICDNSDYVVNFTFDSEWDAMETKTARFIYGGTYEDVVFEGNSCSVPVIENARSVLIGVYAGALRTTTPAYVRCVKSVRAVNGAPSDPTAAVYDQILALLNSMGSVSTEDIEQAVADYMAAHPSSGSYSLPVATDKILGGIKVGTNLSIEADGTLSATAPSTGIPKSDLASDVQTSLGKADTALQSYTETDPTVPAWAKANAKPSYTAGEVGAYTKTEVNSKIAAAKTSIASYKIVTSFMSSLNLLSIAWSAFGSGVSLSTFTNIFNNHLLYSIIVNDPAENGSGETKLIFDNFNDDDQCLYGHFIYNNATRYFKADSTGISEISVSRYRLISDSYSKTEVDTKIASIDMGAYAKTSDIPTKTSQLTNDSGFLTEHQSLSEYAKTSDIPTKTSQLTNDSGFLTEHQSLSEYAKTSDVNSKIAAAKTSIASYKIVTSFMSSLNGLSIAWSAFGSGVSLSTFTNIFNNHLLYSIIVNDPAENGSGETKLIFDNFNDDDQCLYGHFIYNNATRYFKADSTGISEISVSRYRLISDSYSKTEVDTKIASIDMGAYAKTSDIPTKTSQLTNDSGFLTSHQDISGKQDKSTLEADVAAKGFTKNTGTYSKPSTGIPKSDLASDVQTSLDKAGTALQSYTETDPTVPDWAKAESKPSYTAEEVGALPITGGTLAGNLSIASGYSLSVADAVQFDAYNSTTSASLSLGGHYENGAGYLQEVELRNLATPTTDLSAANKAYVDAQVSSAVTSGVVKYETVRYFTSQGMSLSWSAFGSDVSYTTFTNIFANHTPYDITVEDAEEGTITRLVFDCWSGSVLYGHFFVNNETRYFKADSTGISEVTVASVSVPTKTSQLTNDSGYLTLDTLPTYGGEVE